MEAIDLRKIQPLSRMELAEITGLSQGDFDKLNELGFIHPYKMRRGAHVVSMYPAEEVIKVIALGFRRKRNVGIEKHLLFFENNSWQTEYRDQIYEKLNIPIVRE